MMQAFILRDLIKCVWKTLLNVHWPLEIVCFQNSYFFFFNEFTFEVTDLFEIPRKVSLLG